MEWVQQESEANRLTTAEWAKKMEERDISNIGLSNGYTWVAALAKKNKKKDIVLKE